MKVLSKIMSVLALGISMSASSADAWTSKGYNISAIDSSAAENHAYITLEGYTNPSCNLNRIVLTDSSEDKFNQMFSMVLSAFHSGTKVKFYFSDTSNCNSNRIQLIK